MEILFNDIMTLFVIIGALIATFIIYTYSDWDIIIKLVCCPCLFLVLGAIFSILTGLLIGTLEWTGIDDLFEPPGKDWINIYNKKSNFKIFIKKITTFTQN